jgi:hypothetical protein
MTLSIMTVWRMTFSIMRVGIMTFSITKLTTLTVSTTAVSMIAFSIVTLSITVKRKCYAECRGTILDSCTDSQYKSDYIQHNDTKYNRKAQNVMLSVVAPY